MIAGSASIRRRRLGIELRQLRTAKGLTLDDLRSRYGWSISKSSRMERGLVPVSPGDVKLLTELYEVTDREIANELITLAVATRQRDWWHKYDDLLPRQFSTYLGFEGDAASIHTYQPLLIPGLLQTEAYARAVFKARQPRDPEEKIARWTEARIHRQALLTAKDAPRLWAVLDEAAVRRAVGGPTVMRDQLAHLIEMSDRRNVMIQVLPFSAGAYMSMDGGFVILRFRDPEDTDVVSADTRTRSHYLDDVKEVRDYTMAYEQLLSLAASPEDSRELIATAIEELE